MGGSGSQLQRPAFLGQIPAWARGSRQTHVHPAGPIHISLSAPPPDPMASAW